jgi:hypothetical protein
MSAATVIQPDWWMNKQVYWVLECCNVCTSVGQKIIFQCVRWVFISQPCQDQSKFITNWNETRLQQFVYNTILLYCKQTALRVFIWLILENYKTCKVHDSFYWIPTITFPCIGKGKGKGKAIPLQALTGPEGSRRLRLADVKIIGKLKW